MSLVQDIEIIHRAVKGLGTDEKALISVLAYRTPEQMEVLKNAWRATHKKELVDVIDSETSGNFGDLLKSLCRNPLEADARSLHKAMEGAGTNEKVLIETLTGRFNAEIHGIKAVYQAVYKKPLESEVRSETSGDFKHWLEFLLSGTRDETGQMYNVDIDVEALYKAGEKRIGTDEKTIYEILYKRNDNYLRILFDAYMKKHGHSIEKMIKKEFSGDAENALLAHVRAVANKPLWIAEDFEDSMAGLGTNDSKLIRLASRWRGPWMGHVKAAYATKYGKPLVKRIQGDTSGDYCKTLVALVGV